MSSVEEKRAANLAKKEEERKAKNQEIAERKRALAEGRLAEKNTKESAEQEQARKRAETDAKRAENIKAKEEARKKAAAAAPPPNAKSSKYSKKDVLELKSVFDQYDKDGDGKIELSEFTKALKDKKAANAPRPGQKSTLAERRSAEGISIADLSEQTFHEMDTDGNGEVTFDELCKLFFKYASKEELKVMMTYVAKAPEPEPEPEPSLGEDAIQQIKKIFKLYDKDNSGFLEKQELLNALKTSGLEKEEITQMFTDFDKSGDNKIDVNEFLKLMEDTGAFF